MRKKMFDAAETNLLQEAARTDKLLEEHSFEVRDAKGGKSDLTVWNTPGDDIYGTVMQCARMVRSAEAILGEEVYHYQTKVCLSSVVCHRVGIVLTAPTHLHLHMQLMRKDPETGGSYPWHQDYGTAFWAVASVAVARLSELLCAVCMQAPGTSTAAWHPRW